MAESVKQRLDQMSSIEENTDELYAIFNSINGNELPMVKINIEAGAYLVRQRINLKDKVFSNISDFYYPPILCCTSYGRANIPFHPMFYCCSFSVDYESPLPRYVSLMETSFFIKDSESVGIERVTCSRWDVIERLDLLALPFSNKYKRTIREIEQIKNGWNGFVNNANISKDAIDLVEYMSNEIAKDAIDGLDYFKIANFIYNLLYINKSTCVFDGIIYPSVAAEGEGFNIAIKPESVDKKLTFSVASLCYLIKNKKDADLHIVNHSTGLSEDGCLIFTPNEDFNMQLCAGYEFVN